MLAPKTDSRVGSVLAGKYRLDRLMGAGGMGAVYDAENTWTGRRVAVKVLHGAMARNEEATRRFLREARAPTRIGHPNIVEVLDMGQEPDGGALYIVQEFLEGADLRVVLARRQTLPPREALETLLPVMAALAAAHRIGIVHRDIKPENIFLARTERGTRMVAKLIDFGIAKEDDASSLHLTRTGAAMGTPYYMSPEQARGDRVLDAQTDVWAIGVVLFEALSGGTPFVGDNYNQLIARIITSPVPSLASRAPAVPPALAAAIDKALRREKAQRYPSMEAFLESVVSACDFAGESWVRSTRRWLDRQLAAARRPRSGETGPHDALTSDGAPSLAWLESSEYDVAPSVSAHGAPDEASHWALRAPAPDPSLDEDLEGNAQVSAGSSSQLSAVRTGDTSAPRAAVNEPSTTLLGPGETPYAGLQALAPDRAILRETNAPRTTAPRRRTGRFVALVLVALALPLALFTRAWSTARAPTVTSRPTVAPSAAPPAREPSVESAPTLVFAHETPPTPAMPRSDAQALAPAPAATATRDSPLASSAAVSPTVTERATRRESGLRALPLRPIAGHPTVVRRSADPRTRHNVHLVRDYDDR